MVTPSTVPKRIVLSGRYAWERPHRMINSMVRRPLNLDEFGELLVELMIACDQGATVNERAALVQYYIRNFELKEEPDPQFDQRIMMEALSFGAAAFLKAWQEQLPGWVPLKEFHFERWLLTDMILVRR